MTENSDLETRVERVEGKLDALSVSVDARFDEVTVAIAEQRQYTELAFDRLRAEMADGFGKVDARFGKVDARFNRLERKLDKVIDHIVSRDAPS